MHPRRTVARALAGAAAVVVAAVPAVSAATPPPADPELFGDVDPRYDGVWRQSMALLAQDAVGYVPAGSAVDWLLRQQCDDGSFLVYRAAPGRPCRDVTAADTRATALAVQALAALGGHERAVSSAVSWLRGVQNEDGGWGSRPGDATDASSTAYVVGGLVAAGEDPEGTRRSGASPYDALSGLQLGCEAAEEERGAFARQPDEASGELHADDAATVDAVLALYGSGLVVDASVKGDAGPLTPLDCAAGEENGAGADGEERGERRGEQSGAEAEAEAEAEADERGTVAEAPPAAGTDEPVIHARAAAGAAYLEGILADNDEHLMSTMAGSTGQPDYATTAKAVVALAAGRHDEVWQRPLDWLTANHAAWPDHTDDPAAVGLLVLAAHAGGTAPDDFGDTDLVEELVALGPAPEEAPEPAGSAESAEEVGGGGGAGAAAWVTGIGLTVGIGIGVVLSLRRRQRRS